MKKVYFHLFLFVGIFTTSFAQKKDTTKTVQVPIPTASANQLFPFLNVVPPSPEASSLGRYGEIPVSLSNGTASFDIPIYEIVSGSLRVPVKISYHSSGVKVNDISSTVGTGWSLQAGGAISRVMKGGIWDECSYGILNNTIPEESNTASFMCFLGNLNTTLDYVDGMPDDFFYNFNNYSGKFVYNSRTTSNTNITPIPITYPYSPLKIEWIGQTYFIISDADGTVYRFENLETTVLSQSARTNPCGSTYTSAWYLTKIISPNKIDEITFSYTTPQKVDSSPIWSTTLTKRENEFGAKTFTYQYANQRTDINSIVLTEINYKNGKVSFSYSNDRQDQNDTDTKRLSTITIYKKDANENLSEVKHFSLNHSYFSCSDGYSQVDNPPLNISGHTDKPYLLKRLKLDSVTEFAPNNQSNPPYTFSYYEDQPLPIYGALAQDYFGYSNGASANKNLLLRDTDPNRTEEPSTTWGANCTPNYNYAVSGALKKIIYPTKGYTELFYESNTLVNGNNTLEGGGIRIKKIISDDLNGASTQVSYNYVNSYFTNSIYQGSIDDNTYTFSFTVNQDSNGNYPCVQHTFTNYPEKVSASLGSEATAVAHEEVEEYHENGIGNRIGKKRYKYLSAVDLSLVDFPIERISMNWKRGLLLNEKVYKIQPNNTDLIQQETQTTFTETFQPYKTRGYVVRITYDNDYYTGICQVSGGKYCDKYSVYNTYTYAELNEQSSVLLPTQTIVTRYDDSGNNPVVTTTNNEYNTVHLQPTKTTIANSDGKTYETVYRYPHDYVGNTVYDGMINRHIYSPVIEIEEKENTTTLRKVRTNYTQWYPSTYFGDVLGFYAPLSVESQEYNNAYETEVMMGEQLLNPSSNGYDLRARPILYTERSGLTHSLEWWDDWGKKDFLKKKTTGNLYVNYDYEPAIGLKSVLDQNNLGSQFAYDVFSRLNLVKDQNTNLTDQYKYSYATTAPIGCTTPPPPTISIGTSTACDVTLNASECSGIVNWSNGMAGNSISVSTKETVYYTATCSVSTCTSGNSNQLQIPVLPDASWSVVQIGTPPTPYCVQENSGTWTISGTGNTSGTSDNLSFPFVSISGNAIMVAKLNTISANLQGMRSGIMMRANNTPTADYYQFFFDSGYQVLSLYEQNSSTGDGQIDYQASSLAVWLRLKKEGDTISAWYSQSANPTWNNDADWTLYKSVTNSSFGGINRFGLVVYNNAYGSNSTTNQTTFTNVSINSF